jgi:hypothetical protein
LFFTTQQQKTLSNNETGVSILDNYHPMSFGGKIMEKGREKVGKCKRRGRTWKQKEERGKKVRKGSKR